MKWKDLADEVEVLRRKLAHCQRAHEVNEERYQLFARAATEAIIVHYNQLILDVNRAAQRIFGYEMSEMLGMDFSLLLVEPNNDQPLEALWRRKDGSTFFGGVSRSMTVVNGETLILTAVRDLTAQKMVEQELRSQLRRFEDIAANAQEWIWEVDARGRYTYASPVVEVILGYSPTQILEKHFYDLFIDEESHDLKRTAMAAFASKEPFRNFVNRNSHRDGQQVWLSTSGVPILDLDGTFLGYRGVDTDITQQIKNREELRRSEQEFRLAFEASKDAILWADPQSGVVTRCNMAAEILLERSREEIIGMHQTEVHPPDKAEQYALMFRDHVQRGGTFEEEAEVITAGRTIKNVIITSSLPQIEGGELLQGVFRDITDRKKEEARRQMWEERVQQAQKLESLGLLAGGIAHDFNNLLAAIMGNVGLAMMRLEHSSPARINIQKIENVASRAAELTNQLLAYSGKGRFVVHPIDINELVDEMANLLQAVISKRATLKYELGPSPLVFEGDPTQVGQVVMNLITNGSDAIGDNDGVITVTTGMLEADERYLSDSLVEEAKEGPFVFVEVSDTGQGMDDDTRTRMFDPFFTTKQTGRGLGLAAVLGIVRGHHGALRVESNQASGTTIRILFPTSEGVAHGQSVVKPRDVDGWVGHGLVLVIDDEEVVREMARMVLEEAGFSVLEAANGRRGIEVFKEHVDQIRAVLLDMTMPVMGGPETLRELRRIDRSVRVGVSSGYNEE
ncbi:MAG: PAS domain S-box protein, partial [Proteobacteria bacterium]|nr:PAS domain S-box protein [Pseudomonadota bacterium]